MNNNTLPITRTTVLNALQVLADIQGSSNIGAVNTKELCKELFKVYEEYSRGDNELIKWGQAPRHIDPDIVSREASKA